MSQAGPDPVILSFGPALAAAEALAHACGPGTPVAAFDPDLLDHALQAGRRCLVVWSPPQTALAAALRDGTPPRQIAADWTRFADRILARAAQDDAGPGTLTLIEASAIHAQSAALLLAPDLTHALPDTLPAAPDDTAARLAQVLMPHLPDLTAAWHRLRDASLAAPTPPEAQPDLDDLAGLGRALDRTLHERDLLRDQLLAMTALKQTPLAQAAASDTQATEIALLRQQLRSLAALASGSAPDPATQSDSPTAAQSSEIILLRAHLSYLHADLGLGNHAPTAQPDAPTQPDLLPAIAHLLADLVLETDRRILAERETLAARKALRHLGIEAPALLARNPVAPRPPD